MAELCLRRDVCDSKGVNIAQTSLVICECKITVFCSGNHLLDRWICFPGSCWSESRKKKGTKGCRMQWDVSVGYGRNQCKEEKDIQENDSEFDAWAKFPAHIIHFLSSLFMPL